MIKRLIPFLCLASAITNTFASVTFFNNSEQDSIVVYYSICTDTGQGCQFSPLQSIDSIPSKSAYVDKDINLQGDQQLFVQQVLAIMPNRNTFTTQFAKTIPNYNNCYVDGNLENTDDGVIFYTFDKQSIATCASSTGVN